MKISRGEVVWLMKPIRICYALGAKAAHDDGGYPAVAIVQRVRYAWVDRPVRSVHNARGSGGSTTSHLPAQIFDIAVRGMTTRQQQQQQQQQLLLLPSSGPG
jgi:hypothetical protein